MRRTLWLVFLLLIPCLVGAGESDFRLPRCDGAGDFQLSSLAGGPVVLWFPAPGRETEKTLNSLAQLVSENHASLVVIPSVGTDVQAGQNLARRFPGLPVLLDADGSVTLRFTGEFIPGVAPRKNFFVLDSQSQVKVSRYYPGVSPKELGFFLSGK